MTIPDIFSADNQPKWQALEAKLIQLQAQGSLAANTTLPQLYSLLESHEADMMRSFLKLEPSDYGINMPHTGLSDVPDNLQAVQTDLTTKFAKRQLVSFMPRPVAEAFLDMRQAFGRDHPGRTLCIESAYRSPAYQLVTLVYYLVNVHDYSLPATLTQVALPGYSWHCSVDKTSLDLANIDGQPSDEAPQDFSQSIEYAWLCEHGNDYGFYETYARNNSTGIMWEPWHWQYLGRDGNGHA